MGVVGRVVSSPYDRLSLHNIHVNKSTELFNPSKLKSNNERRALANVT